MFPFNWFPGTNMHDLDLDWVIKTVKDLWKRMDAFTVKTIEIIVDTVNTWLDEHPEATTTVQDGAITFSKLNESMLGNALQVPYMATDEDSIKWQTLGVTPQMYGAAADGETDDTGAVKAALENNNFIFFPEGTYLCDWKAMDLTGKHIKGANKDKTIIKHRNFGYPFGIVGQYTTISDLTFTTENNVELTPALVFGWYNEEFTLFNGHCLNNIKFICDTFTRAIMFNMDGRGSLGGDIHDIYINGGYSGIECILQRNLTHGSSSGTGWITGQTFDNIVITDYKKYGFAIRFISDTGRMFSHNKISGVRCEAFNDGSIGFALVPDSYTIINPVVFNDNQEGTAYSIEFAPEEYISSRYPTIVGGTMEGALINKQFMYQYDLIGTIFIIRNNINSSNTYRYVPKVQSILYGKEFIDSYSSLSELDTAYKSNVTIGGGIDSYGKYIRLTRTAAGNKATALFLAPLILISPDNNL